MRRRGRAGLVGAAVAFLRSPQGQRMLLEARRRYDTPENRARVRQTVTELRQRRGGGGRSGGIGPGGGGPGGGGPRGSW